MGISIFNIAGAPKWLRGLMEENFTESSAPKTSVFDGLEPEFLDAIEKNSSVTVDMLDTSQKVAAYATRYSKKGLGEGAINGMAPIVAAERIAAAINKNPDLLDETSAQAVLNMANDQSSISLVVAREEPNLIATVSKFGADKITEEHFANLAEPLKPLLFYECAESLSDNIVNSYTDHWTKVLDESPKEQSRSQFSPFSDSGQAVSGLSWAIGKNPDLLNEDTATAILMMACKHPQPGLSNDLKRHGSEVITDETFDAVREEMERENQFARLKIPGSVLEACASQVTSHTLIQHIETFPTGSGKPLLDHKDLTSLAEAVRTNPALIDEDSTEVLSVLAKGAPPYGQRANAEGQAKRSLAKSLEEHASAQTPEPEVL